MQALGDNECILSCHGLESRPTHSWDMEREGLGEELCWSTQTSFPSLLCQSGDG